MSGDPHTLAADLETLVPLIHWNADVTSAHGIPNPADVLRQAAAILTPFYDAWLEANPPCPTCGGTGSETVLDCRCDDDPDGPRHEAHDHSYPCTVCGDTDHPGRQSFTDWCKALVALWTRVHDTNNNYNGIHLLDELRQIGGTR